MTILIDMDDTIETLLASWLAVANERYGTSVRYEDVSDWDITKAFPGYTHEQIYGLILEKGFWKNVFPIEHAKEVIDRLRAAGNKLYIVTATPKTGVEEKMDMLFKYFPEFSWDDVIITAHKQMVMGDYLIDDNPKNLLGGSYKKILIDCPHNLKFDAEKNAMIRVHDWYDIEKIFF